MEGKVRLGRVYLSVRSGLHHAAIWISDDYQVILVRDNQYYYVEYNLTAEVIRRVVVSPCTESRHLHLSRTSRTHDLWLVGCLQIEVRSSRVNGLMYMRVI